MRPFLPSVFWYLETKLTFPPHQKRDLFEIGLHLYGYEKGFFCLMLLWMGSGLGSGSGFRFDPDIKIDGLFNSSGREKPTIQTAKNLNQCERILGTFLKLEVW